MSDPRDYIDKIRNPAKRAYADAFYDHLRNGTPEPARPAGLSYMAAQAVRWEVNGRFLTLLGESA